MVGWLNTNVALNANIWHRADHSCAGCAVAMVLLTLLHLCDQSTPGIENGLRPDRPADPWVQCLNTQPG